MEKKPKKFELGPIQKKWIEELKSHPERQLSSRLGRKEKDNKVRACCLGQYLICYNQMRAHKKIWVDNILVDGYATTGEYNEAYLTNSWEKLGLYDEKGKLASIANVGWTSLASMNDQNMSWLEIAKFIEDNPENVFTKSI